MSNIITATFSCGSTTASASGLWQYDYGQKLIFADLDLPPVYEVHFANEGETETITVLGDETGVDIPDQFLLSGNAVRAWVFLHTGTEDGETMYAVRMPVNKRPEPSDIEPTPVQQDIITQAIAALDAAVEQTGQDVETTAGYMDRAEQAADRAEQAAQGVEEYAGRAETAAEAAEASATSAGQSEQTATQAASAAVTAADQAGTSAGQAQQAASDAGQAATQAANAASAAGMFATTAEAKAAEAVASASAAAGSAASAADSEAVASQAAQTASQAATQASQSATSASNSATSAAQSATSAEQSAQSAEQSAESILGVLPEIQQDITDLQDTKADKDGSYDYLTAGLAKQLATDKGIADSVPYLMRPSGGGVAVGTYEQDKIVGGSIIWNQLNVNRAITSSGGGVTFTKNDNGSWTLTGAGTGIYRKQFANNGETMLLKDHVYFLSFGENFSGSASTIQIFISAFGGSTYGLNRDSIAKMGVDRNQFSVRIYAGFVAPEGGLTIIPQVFDLTAMFGATVADYIHGLDTATAGAGVSWLKQHFPEQFDSGYQEYNAGEIKSVGGLVSHDTTGFNRFDKTKASEVGYRFTSTGIGRAAAYYASRAQCSDYIKVIPGQEYYFRNVFGRGIMTPVYWYDFDKQFISSAFVGNGVLASGVATAPNNAAYVGVNFETTEISNVCVNRSNSQNGEYEPYERHSYPLDTDLVLRGIPKLDANNLLYYDGDIYNPDGTVERRYAERAYQSGDESLADALTDGTVTVYKLTTPTTEQTTPYQTPQLVDPDGTEEYVLADEAFPMPVGHETFYPMDLKKKIEDLPDSFVSDVQVDGVSVVQDGVANIPKELPNAPSSGEYVLKSNNGAVSWGSAPSGGGNSWELIASYTVTENSESVEITTDLNGQPFSLDRMFVRVSAPATLTGTKDYIRTEVKAETQAGALTSVNSPAVTYPSATGVGRFEFSTELVCDIVVTSARQSSGYGSSSSLAVSSANDINGVPLKSIRGFRVYQYNANQTLVPAGTIIKIYGVRR